MRDKGAQRCLLHRTFGYALAVTQDNVGELLEEIRRSTAEEVKEEVQRRERKMKEEHERQYTNQNAELHRVLGESDKLQKEKNNLLSKRDEVDQAAIERACKSARVVERQRKAIVLGGYVAVVAVVTYLASKVNGCWVYPLCGLIALVGFWFVPEKLFRKWIDKAWHEKLLSEIKASKIENWDKRFHLDRDSCKAHKILE
jgi:hypothetical protein